MFPELFVSFRSFRKYSLELFSLFFRNIFECFQKLQNFAEVVEYSLIFLEVPALMFILHNFEHAITPQKFESKNFQNLSEIVRGSRNLSEPVSFIIFLEVSLTTENLTEPQVNCCYFFPQNFISLGYSSNFLRALQNSFILQVCSQNISKTCTLIGDFLNSSNIFQAVLKFLDYLLFTVAEISPSFLKVSFTCCTKLKPFD